MGTITPLYLQLASDPVYATTADTLNDFGRDGGSVGVYELWPPSV